MIHFSMAQLIVTCLWRGKNGGNLRLANFLHISGWLTCLFVFLWEKKQNKIYLPAEAALSSKFHLRIKSISFLQRKNDQSRSKIIWNKDKPFAMKMGIGVRYYFTQTWVLIEFELRRPPADSSIGRPCFVRMLQFDDNEQLVFAWSGKDSFAFVSRP